MKKLKLQLEYCYGIRKLDVVLEYAGAPAVAIYAPNGAMKSSLANTFQDIAEGKLSRDRIFPNRATTRIVQDENSVDVAADKVLEADPHYRRLTSLLHWKADTAQITTADLDAIYINLFGTNGQSGNGATPIVDLLAAEVAACLQAADGINFENKVILAIAIRLQAEKFMAAKINDPAWLAGITANQTPILLKRYRNEFPAEIGNLGVIQRVLLMTPENIHLNAFMYEPILDMSDQHLRRLYSNVVAMA